jgi:hypothetical protein
MAVVGVQVKAEAYKNKSLHNIFLMNNVHYMVRAPPPRHGLPLSHNAALGGRISPVLPFLPLFFVRFGQCPFRNKT